MQDKEIVELVDNPTTFNYAISCAAFEFNLKNKPRILLVDYQKNAGHDVQKRLPAGRFQIQDLITAVESFINDLYMKENGRRNLSLEFFLNEADTLYKRYLPLAVAAKNDNELNSAFNDFTEKLLIKFQGCQIDMPEFKAILKQTHLNTVIHELREETDAKEIGKIYLSSCSCNLNGHYKIGFTSTEVKAPESHTGSSDEKILKSYWEEIDENTSKIIFGGHYSKFQAGMGQIIRLGIHPNSLELSKFFLANS